MKSNHSGLKWSMIGWGFVYVAAVVLVFYFGSGGWDTFGYVWVFSGLAAFLAVLVTKLSTDSFGQLFNIGMFALYLGPVGLVLVLAARVPDWYEARYSARH